MFSIKRISLIVAAGALIALAAAACGDDDDANGASGGEAASREEVQKAEVLAAMTLYRAEGLHLIDDEAQEASEIAAGWSGSVTRMRQATAGVDWPDIFVEQAQTLESELMQVEEAIDAEDLAAVKEHITLAHETWHEFEEEAYAYIAGEEAEEGEDHEESASPTASQ